MGEKCNRRPTMKRLEVIVEGQTELEFVRGLLSPYFYEKGAIIVSPILLRTSINSRGGFVNYKHLKDDILRSLHSQNQELIVTTFVDFFRLPISNIPGYDKWKNECDHSKQIDMIEKSIKQDIKDSRFVPYIQKHEFEALLFSSDRGFLKYYTNDKVQELNKIRYLFPNPEDINTSPQGAPSKRLLSIVPSYEKIIDGNIIALEIGLETMKEQCPHFSRWLSTIEEYFIRLQ